MLGLRSAGPDRGRGGPKACRGGPQRATSRQARLAVEALLGAAPERPDLGPVGGRGPVVRARARGRGRGDRGHRAVRRGLGIRAGVSRRALARGAAQDGRAQVDRVARREGARAARPGPRPRRRRPLDRGRPHPGGRAPDRGPQPPGARGGADRRVAAGGEADGAAPGSRAGARRPQEHGLRRHPGHLRSWAGAARRHWHGDRVRQAREAATDGRGRSHAAAREPRQAGAHAGARGARDRRRDRRARVVPRPAAARDVGLRDRLGRRGRAGGAPGGGDDLAGARRAASGETGRPDAAPAGDRDAGQHDRNLLGQDGHADQGRDDGDACVRRWRALGHHRERVRTGGRVHLWGARAGAEPRARAAVARREFELGREARLR